MAKCLRPARRNELFSANVGQIGQHASYGLSRLAGCSAGSRLVKIGKDAQPDLLTNFLICVAPVPPRDAITKKMGTVRFSKVVEAAGKPIVHVLWVDPAKDATLRKAIKAVRVMTVHQQPAAKNADYGMVGFEKNVSGQILIFPKSIEQFSDQRVIGVKYDLIEWPAVPKNQQAPKASPPKHSTKSEPPDPKMIVSAGKRTAIEEHASARVVKFPTPGAENAEATSEDLEELKNQVRQAMKLLEEGRQVAAFNLLKRIIGN